MGFIINENKIPFHKYDKLLSCKDQHPFVTDIVEFLSAWFDDQLDHITVLTSGSTGSPKHIKLTKDAMRQSAYKTLTHFQLKNDSIALLSLPVKYIAGKMMLVRAIEGKLELILVEPCAQPLADIKSSIDFLPMTAMQFRASCKEDSTSFNKVKTVLLGGGPIDVEIKTLAKNIKARVVHGFGMTETITHIATCEISEDHYTALPGVKFSKDEQNRLSIEADHLGESIQTNDLVELLCKSKFVWEGRFDNVINSGGVKLSPELIESKIISSFANAYFIAGEIDENLGEKVVLYIESSEPSHFKDLMEKLKEQLSKYELPKEVYLLSQFIRTETGKINRSLSVNDTQNKIIL